MDGATGPETLWICSCSNTDVCQQYACRTDHKSEFIRKYMVDKKQIL